MTGGTLPWLTLGRDISAKSVLLLLVAWALTLTMRRASAAARHLVWLLTFGGLLALPLLSVTLPRLPSPSCPDPPRLLPCRPPPFLPSRTPFRSCQPRRLRPPSSHQPAPSFPRLPTGPDWSARPGWAASR